MPGSEKPMTKMASFGPLRKVVPAPGDEMARRDPHDLFVTGVRSGPEEWMCYCIEVDTRTGGSTVLDHTMSEVPVERYQVDMDAQGVPA